MSRNTDDSFFEVVGPGDGNPCPIFPHREAQGGKHAIIRDVSRDLQSGAVVTDGGQAHAIDDRALFCNGILLGSDSRFPIEPA